MLQHHKTPHKSPDLHWQISSMVLLLCMLLCACVCVCLIAVVIEKLSRNRRKSVYMYMFLEVDMCVCVRLCALRFVCSHAIAWVWRTHCEKRDQGCRFTQFRLVPVYVFLQFFANSYSVFVFRIISRCMMCVVTEDKMLMLMFVYRNKGIFVIIHIFIDGCTPLSYEYLF